MKVMNSLEMNQSNEYYHNKSQRNSKSTINDWYYINNLRNHCSENQQKLTRKIIAKSKDVCELTSEKVISNRNETNHCINERINEIEFCKQELVRIRNELPVEIDALTTYKNRLIESVASLRQNALEICEKCLLTRECRLGIDLVSDNVLKQLRLECNTIKCADQLMSKTLEQITEQIRHLKSALYYIDRDIEDKQNNLRIDMHNLTLKETSLNLSVYHGKSALSASSITLEEWEMQTKKNIDESNKEIQIGKQIRSHIDHVLKKIITDLINQKNLTNEAFRQRIEETKEAKEKFELQHSEIMRQASDMTRNITMLEKKIAEKEGFIALAHTRLGNRCQRPGLELTCDYVEKSLSKEVSDLRETIIHLQQTLFEAQTSLRFLLKMQIQLEEDINIKTNTLKIDEVKCMSIRQSIDYHVF